MNLNDASAAAYEADFARWLQHQMELLAERRFDQLDVVNLTDEIGGILRSEKRQLESRLEVITLHLLKCRYQPEREGASWHKTLRAQRRHLARLLRDSPSLRPHVRDFAVECYRHAVAEAADETGMPMTAFLAELPFTDAELLDPSFVP